MTAQLVVATLVVLGVLGGVAALAAGFGDSLAPAWRDAAPLPLPTGRWVSADDLAATRFAVAFRGYRMAEVDLVLSRLADELAERDDELARLRGDTGDEVPAPGDEVPALAEAPAADGAGAPADAQVADAPPSAGDAPGPRDAPEPWDVLRSDGQRGG